MKIRRHFSFLRNRMCFQEIPQNILFLISPTSIMSWIDKVVTCKKKLAKFYLPCTITKVLLLKNISEKKPWFTVGFSCTKWHYLILVTLSADNHRLLDFLFRFPKKYFLVSGGVSRKNWKWITALDRVATMIQIMHEFLFFFSQIKSIITFSGLILYKKKIRLRCKQWFWEKSHESTYVLGSSLDV